MTPTWHFRVFSSVRVYLQFTLCRLAVHQWLTLVIPATREEEAIRRIDV
jgi:hypothetical protein